MAGISYTSTHLILAILASTCRKFAVLRTILQKCLEPKMTRTFH